MAAAPDDDARRTLAELEAKLRELERELLRGYEPDAIEADPFAAPPDEAPADEAAPEPAAPAALHPGEAPPAFDPGEWAAPEPAAEPEPELEVEPEGGEPEPEVEPEPAGEPEGEPLHAAEAEPVEELEPEPVAQLDHDALAHAHDLLDNLRATIEDMGLTAQRVTAEAQAVADDHGRTLGRLARVAHAAARAEDAAFEAGRIAATVVVEAGPFADAGAVTALRDTLAAQPGARDAYVRGVEDGRAVIEVHLAPPPT